MFEKKKKIKNLRKHLQEKFSDISNKYIKKKEHISIIIGAILIFSYSIFIQTPVGAITYVGDSISSFPSENEIERLLKETSEEYLKKSITITTSNETSYEIALSSLGLSFDIPATLKEVDILQNRNIFTKTFRRTRIIPKIHIDKDILIHALLKVIPELQDNTKDATVKLLADNSFSIFPEKQGYSINYDTFIDQLIFNAQKFQVSPLRIQIQKTTPKIFTQAAQRAKQHAEYLSEKIFLLQYAEKHWEIPMQHNKDWFIFEPVEDYIHVTLSPSKVSDYINTQIKPLIEIEKKDISIEYPKDLPRVITGIGRNGISLNINQLVLLMKEAIDTEKFEITIPIDIIKAQVLQKENPLGITELLAEGMTGFDGSPKNRMHNIGVGAERFQNTIIEPKGQFSFLDILGPVNKASGYLPELVIKGGGTETIKEYGGGLCQVSSTVYRAVLKAGLKIDKRRNHSYFVTYYKPEGLDATIYDPVQDFIFTNDTDHFILIQNEIDWENNLLYFRIWGTYDDRQIRLDGPYTYAYTGMPAPIYTDTTDIPVGAVRQASIGHVGFQADWYRYIKRVEKDEEEKELFHSYYKAIPPKYLRGVSP